MTYETADRIFELMRDIRLWDAEHDALDHRAVARQIAAEIDALTRERDEARMYGKLTDVAANSLNAELKECQSALRLALAGTEQHYFAIPARIDDVRAALAVAQSQLAEARAEVERLRPAAEAWEALQAAYQGLGNSIEYAYSVACVTRAKIIRARAARGDA